MTTNWPLSPQQRQLWRLMQTAGAAPFRCRAVLELEEAGAPLDRAALRDAVEDAVRRHEVLRTRIAPGAEGDPVQFVDGATPVTWSEGGPARLEEETAGRAGLRAHLSDAGDSCHLLLVDAPAFQVDGRGLENLLRDVAAAYEALRRGGTGPEVALQYRLLARWQNQILEGEGVELGRDFWLRQDFSGLLAMRLPGEEAAVGGPFAPAALPVPLTPVTAAHLPAVAVALGVSLEALLGAAWHALLRRITGLPEVIVGTAVDGRSYADLETAVGLFARHLPLRFKFGEGTPFAEVAWSYAEAAGEAAEWQEYFTWEPFRQALGRLAGALFFPCTFQYRELPAAWHAGGLRFTLRHVDERYDQFRVALSCTSGPGEDLHAELHYDRNAIPEADALRLSEALAALLGAVVAEPHAAVADLDVVGPAERRRLLVDFQPSAGPLRRADALHRFFEEWVARAPEATAVLAGESRLSYGELDARANCLARHLIACGVRPGDLVGLAVERTVDMPVGVLGILKAGAAYLPLDASYPTDRLALLLADAGVRRIVAADALVERLPGSGAELVLLGRDAAAIARRSAEAPGLTLAPEFPAYVMYTSGSTGRPRGVVITHGCVAYYVQALGERIGLRADDRYLHTASVAFSSSVRQLMLPLSRGAASVIADQEQRVDPAALWREIVERQVTVIDFVPSHWRACLRWLGAISEEERRRLRAAPLRLGLSASEPLLVNIPVGWRAGLGDAVRLVNMYGQTETTGIVATFSIPEALDGIRGVVPAGQPIPGTRIYLLDSRHRPVPLGVAGEICVAGDSVGQGYLGRPDLTAERMVPDPFDGAGGGRLYRTGDLGRLRSDGTLELLGRRDEQVKVRGFRVEPGEVQVVLSRHQGVREAAVVVRHESPGTERLVAYVVPAEQRPPVRAELLGFLRRDLPEHMVPSSLVFLERLPLTPNGKLDRLALPAPGRDAGGMESDYVAPRTPLEKTVTGLWAELLGIERVGIHDDFFAIGGHSLLATLLMSRLRDACGIELPVLALFRAPTVAGLCAELSAQLDAGPALPAPDRITRTEPDEVQRLLADLDQLSDEQVQELLGRMLSQGTAG